MSRQDDILALFWQFTLLSLLAVGGLNSVIPDMQRYVVEQGWLTARQFGEVYALSQATPGPNVMVVTMLGAIIAGWSGAVAVTIALFLPGAILTSAMIHLNTRNPDTIFALAVRRGLAPVTIGLTLSTAWVMLHALSTEWSGVAMAFVTALVVLRTRVNPLWLIGTGALVGMLDIF
ncbi:MAG: chromate transporter [Betaproteobacteria bacterium]|nr:chromate transporter [Betaproteobacteria bacterium]